VPCIGNTADAHLQCSHESVLDFDGKNRIETECKSSYCQLLSVNSSDRKNEGIYENGSPYSSCTLDDNHCHSADGGWTNWSTKASRGEHPEGNASSSGHQLPVQPSRIDLQWIRGGSHTSESLCCISMLVPLGAIRCVSNVGESITVRMFFY